MQTINLTPHDVHCYDRMGNFQFTINASGNVARLKEMKLPKGFLETMPLYAKTYNEVENLPAPEPTKVYIVSSQIVESLRGTRSDIIAPDDLVRDPDGKIIGCKSFWFAQ